MRTAHGETTELKSNEEHTVEFSPSIYGMDIGITVMVNEGVADIRLEGGLREEFTAETRWVTVAQGQVGEQPSQIGELLNILYPRYRVVITGTEGQRVSWVAMSGW